MDLSYIKRNTERILERVERAAQAAGRRAEDITVLAAVKYARPDEIDYLCRECGILHIGENRVQQLLGRRSFDLRTREKRSYRRN